MQMLIVFIIFLISCTFYLNVDGRKFQINPTCTPPTGTKCVEVYECPYFISLLKNSTISKLHIIREIRRKQCGFLNNNPAVCCTREEEIETAARRNSHLLPLENCGPVSLVSRITNGKKTVLNEFPWMALIAYNTDNGLEFLCGGTLISEKYVLTAAHCIQKTVIGVRLGEYDVVTTKDCDDKSTFCSPPVQDFHIEKIIVHAEHNVLNNQHDIALIRLSKPANMSFFNIRPICLPLERNSNLEGKLLTVTGWGMTETGFRSSILLKTSVPVIPLPICQKIYDGQIQLGSKQLCAGGKEEDSCNGDSGGPLGMIVPNNKILKYVQYGIVSYGPKACGTLGRPGIYTRVDSYIDWILDTLEP